MDLPILIINFKTYREASAHRGSQLAKIAEHVAKEYTVSFAVVPQLIDCVSIAQEVEIPVFTQHIDPQSPGSSTGHINSESLSEQGISGTLLNHSERRLDLSLIEESVGVAKSNNLLTVVCSPTIELSEEVSSFNPWAVAMEPPELIGGDVSVTTKPDIVQSAVEAINRGSSNTIPLTGAGVKTAQHVKSAVELGSRGVLLASGIVKHKDPQSILTEIAQVMGQI